MTLTSELGLDSAKMKRAKYLGHMSNRLKLAVFRRHYWHNHTDTDTRSIAISRTQQLDDYYDIIARSDRY